MNGIATPTYNLLIEKAVRYALISVSFTYNRMDLRNLKQKIRNIAKGQIAELLFHCFCVENNIAVDFDSCSTPFFLPDKRDFLADHHEWDLKNNFLYHAEDIIAPTINYTDLPALVPNSYDGDQWSKRDQRMMGDSLGVRFLFTYMKLREHREGFQNFFDINLSQDQQQLIADTYEKHRRNHISSEPFTSESFFDQLQFDRNQLIINDHPHLVITGYADQRHWQLFENSGEEKQNYCGGLLYTRINNSLTQVKNLPSFLSLYPHLKEKIKCATLRNAVAGT